MPTNIIVIIVVSGVMFSSGYYLANRKSETVKQSIIKTENEKIVELNDKYEKSISSYKEQLSNLQKNNITTSKTVYLTSGEKIVTKTVDRTITSTEINKRATEEIITGEINSKTYEVNTSSSMQFEKSSSLANYKIGITGLQYTDFKDFSGLKISSGLRILSTPLFVTLQVPTTSNFYKNIEFGMELEL